MAHDILITGTGMFAGRIALDIAATARTAVTVVIAGRNQMRLDWLRTAGNARAAMFGTKARFLTRQIDLLEPGASETLLKEFSPRLVVQAASIQTSSVISDGGSRWTDIVAQAGLSATAAFQALISGRMAAAITAIRPQTRLINCSFPDVVNSMLAGMGHEVMCGTGNVAILSNVFEGARDALPAGQLRVLAHYQCLAPWRQAPQARLGQRAPRVFIDQTEITDVFAAFSHCQLTPEPAIEISGASGVTLMLAYIEGVPWRGHVPGPDGLPGGYPVKLIDGRLELDLPSGVTRDEAMSWNDSFERQKGLTVENGQVLHHGTLRELLAQEGSPHAEGFALQDLETVCQDMMLLRDQLMQQPSTR